jgi:hypothetical protein
LLCLFVASIRGSLYVFASLHEIFLPLGDVSRRMRAAGIRKPRVTVVRTLAKSDIDRSRRLEDFDQSTELAERPELTRTSAGTATRGACLACEAVVIRETS